MNLVRLNIKGISYSQTQNGAYALLLSEEKGERQLPIVIGAFEAQSIAIALEKDIKPPRPLTHDLFKSFADEFTIRIKQVIIHKLLDGVFYSSLVCERDKTEEIIDARTSDAVAIALRFEAPIFTYKNILDKAGIQLKTEDHQSSENPFKEDEPKKKRTSQEKRTSSSKEEEAPFSHKSLASLKTALEQAVKHENYEKAARLRDEISKRE